MRIALIADIHANLEALDAVLGDIAARGVDGVYHLGDLVGYAATPNEVVARLTARAIAGVAGNYDSTVATDHPHCGCRSENPRQEELAHQSYAITRALVTPETRGALARLPFSLDVRPFGGHRAGPRLVLVHGTPTRNTVYWTADRSDEFCLTMARRVGLGRGDLIAFGHTHVPWHREIEGIHFVNAGSVGRPKDGDWRACYALVDLDGDGVAVSHVRCAYDVEATVARLSSVGLPAEFGEFLRTGGRPGAVRGERRPAS